MPMRVTSTGTPIPKRGIEEQSRGSGPVITYRLSPEELERVRRGERLKTRKEEATMSTTTAPKAPDKLEVLRRLAAGWKIARIEEELGLSKGALQYWLGKWGLKGVRGEQAQRLLDETLIDQKAEYTAEPATNTEQPADSPASAEIVQGLKDHELIERLKKELAEKAARIAELEAERDALLQTIEKAVDTEPAQPDHDPVNHPAHYTAGKVECIDAIESATVGLTGGLAYATGAAIKYLWRWNRKNGVEDLRKARWHVDRLIEIVEGAR